MSAKLAYQGWIRELWATADILDIADIPLEVEGPWWTHPEGRSPEQQQAIIKRQMKKYLEPKSSATQSTCLRKP
jgi:hypothetical protein